MVAKVAPLLVIVGETASGKSDLAMKLAERLGGELICADSWTVYKGFDVGTAKPSAADRSAVPHHLLDVADPKDGFSVVLFKRLAEQAIADITKRGKLPIIVGGTGLYIDALLHDYSFLPATSPDLRRALNSMELSELIEKAELAGYDLTDIDLRNKRRVVRLIENDGLRPTKKPMRKNSLILGLRRDPEELKQRIQKRIEAMTVAGFADEVKRLGEKYGWDIEPMKAPGYRAFSDYVQGKTSLEAAKERFRQNDLQLAKKQRTWFKRNSSIHWLDYRSEFDDIVELVTTSLNN